MLAFRALETVPVDSERFPSVSTWKNMVQSFTEDSRKRYVFCFYYFFFFVGLSNIDWGQFNFGIIYNLQCLILQFSKKIAIGGVNVKYFGIKLFFKVFF